MICAGGVCSIAGIMARAELATVKSKGEESPVRLVYNMFIRCCVAIHVHVGRGFEPQSTRNFLC
jgi:hypothetical protein